MDYMSLIKNSLDNAWRYKTLWLFGFFVAATREGSLGWKEDLGKVDWPAHIGGITINPALIALIVLVLAALWIVFWVASVISEGALIHGIARGEANLAVGFGDALAAGTGKFLRLFGIMLLATIAILTAILILILFVLPAYFMSKVLGVLLTLVAIPALFVIILIAICVEGWAIRYAVLFDLPWLTAIRQGWCLFRDNIGRTVGVAFSSFLTQFVMGCAFLIVLLILAIPFAIAALSDFWSALIPGLAVGLALLAVAGGILGTFASSVWTLGFMKLTGYSLRSGALAGDQGSVHR